MAQILLQGAGYHHAGLSLHEREITEYLFKERLLKVIFCTTTLAAGVNLPAKRVIITSAKNCGRELTTGEYKQMVGRAGRLGFDTDADSVLICYDKKIGLRIATKELEKINSALFKKQIGLPRVILEAVGTGLASHEQELLKYLQSTLYWTQRPTFPDLTRSEEGTKQLEWLFAQGKEALDFLIYNEILKQQKITSNNSPVRNKNCEENIAAEQDDLSSEQSDFEFQFETS